MAGRMLPSSGDKHYHLKRLCFYTPCKCHRRLLIDCCTRQPVFFYFSVCLLLINTIVLSGEQRQLRVSGFAALLFTCLTVY